MNKRQLINKVKELEGLTKDEKNYLVNIVNYSKEYGLVWENKPEIVEEELKTKLPILKEIKEKAIIKDTEEESYPNHILIEGDNLHALTTLSFTHENKIDIIYIDPPYNTGNKDDFIYNDHYIDKEDTYRHSKWLSFMSKRLEIAKRLLKEDGVIFCSIGDDEQSQLKLLCDEIFGELNFISNVTRIAKRTSDKGTYFKPTKDYILTYAKNISNLSGFGVPKTDDIKKYKFKDEKGIYKKNGASLYQPSLDSRPNQRYWIECPDGSFVIPPGNNYPKEKKDASFLKPESNDDKVWRWSWMTYLKNKDKLIFTKASKKSPLINENLEQSKWNIYDKVYWSKLKGATNLPEDVIYDHKNSKGTKHILGMGIKFSFSKPFELIEHLLTITQKRKDATILDFFAGSGTTLESVMRMNDKDKGSRKAIIVTNNENNIADKVTYRRIKTVINGYLDIKTKLKVLPLSKNNLRYFQCNYVERKPSLKNKKELTKLATELLCIKEECYYEVTSEINKHKWNRLFTDRNGLYNYVIYDDLHIDTAVNDLTKFIENKENKPKVKVYVFSNGQYPYTEDFEDVHEYVELCALPDVIYKAYQNVLPKVSKF